MQSSHISLSSTRPAVSSSSLSSAPVVKDTDVPAEERCVVGWIHIATEDHQHTPQSGDIRGDIRGDSRVLEWQLIALTYLGGWYRLSLPTKDREKEQENCSVGGSVSGGSYNESFRTSVGIDRPGRRASGHDDPAPSPLRPGGLGSVAYESPTKASRRESSASMPKRAEKGKDKDGEKEKHSRDCVLEEYRRFGRWDGWG